MIVGYVLLSQANMLNVRERQNTRSAVASFTYPRRPIPNPLFADVTVWEACFSHHYPFD